MVLLLFSCITPGGGNHSPWLPIQNPSRIPAQALPTVWRSTQELWLPPSISSLGMDEMLCGKCYFCYSIWVCKGRSTTDAPIQPLFVLDFNSKLFCLKQSFPATFPLHLLYISHKSESSKANTRLLGFCRGKRVKSSQNVFPDFKSTDILKHFVCELNPNDFFDTINPSTTSNLNCLFQAICSALYKSNAPPSLLLL